MDLYNYGNGFERDGMQTPPLDFSNHTNVSMTFDHAFRRYNASSADSLVLHVSTDCGNSFQRIAGYAEDGTGSLATAYTNTVEFIPTAGDWCTGTVGADCFTIDLSAYDGESSVVVRFESFNNGIAGNNLFIDNINIDGTEMNNPPVANYSTSANLCLGEDIIFTNNSTGNPTSWSWDFGDLIGTSNLENPIYNYSASGTYTVSLTITNPYGSDTYTQTITVNALPGVVASASSTNICFGDTIFLSASGADTYSWDNGLGSGLNIEVTPSSTITYEVTGTNGNGCINVDQVSITVNANPTVSVASTQSPSSCNISDGSITIGSGGIGNLEWIGPVSGNASNVTLPFTAGGLDPGEYTFSFTDANGCIAQDILATVIDVNTPSQPIIIQGDTVSLCPGQSVDLTSSYASGNTWSTNETTQTISASTIGSYSVYYSDLSGCISAETFIEVIENSPSNIVTNGNVAICIGDDVTLTASGASNYTWDNGAGTGASVTVSPSANTTYVVTGIDANGCQAQGEVSLVVNSLPVVTTAADFSICYGSTAGLSAIGASSYSWDNNGGNGSNISVSPTMTTTYTVTGTDINGCTDTSMITVTVSPLPIVSITPSTLDTLCISGSDPITLSGTPTGGTFTGPGLSGNVFDPSSIGGAGSYTINYVYTDAIGCVGTSSLEATLVSCLSLSENLDEKLILYPNPNNGIFNVSGLNENTGFIIVDAAGRVVHRGVVQKPKNTQFLLDVETGVYFLQGFSGDKHTVIKFIVNN